MASAVGSFRKLSISEQATLTSKDHGPVIGNDKALPRHTVKKAERELKESDIVKDRELDNIKSAIEKEAPTSDQEEKDVHEKVKALFGKQSDSTLVKFLRARKYDTERTYQLMKGYALYRMNYPDLFKDICENEVRRHVEKGQPGVITSRDAQGRVVLFFRFDNWDPDEYPFSLAIKSMVCVLEKLLESEETQINGICLVEDFSGYTLSHLAAVGVSEYKLMIDMLQGSFPCRFKGVHCIRQPWFFTKTFNLIKPYLKQKIFERIYVHGEELSSFFNEFPSDYLPSDLGGTGPAYDGKAAAEMLFGPESEDTAL